MAGLPAGCGDLTLLDRALDRVRRSRSTRRAVRCRGRRRSRARHRAGSRGRRYGRCCRRRRRRCARRRRWRGRRRGRSRRSARRSRDFERHGRVAGRRHGRAARRRLLDLLHGVQCRLARRDAGPRPVGHEELPGHDGEVVAFGRGLRGCRDEVLSGELEHDDIGERPHRRGARAAFEDRDLAEGVALRVVAELALATAGIDLHRLGRAALEQVERRRRVALARDRRARGHLALVELARQILLVLEVEALERPLHVAAGLTPEQLGRAERRGRGPSAIQVGREDLGDHDDHETDEHRDDQDDQQHLQGRRAHVEDVEIDRQRHAVSPECGALRCVRICGRNVARPFAAAC